MQSKEGIVMKQRETILKWMKNGTGMLMLALGLIWMGVGTAQAQISMEQEPNDSFTNAVSVELNTTCYGKADGNDDMDWYTFSLPQPSGVSVSVETNDLFGASNRACKFYKANEKGVPQIVTEGTGSFNDMDLGAGRYYISLDCGAGEVSEYAVTVKTTWVPNDVTGEKEWNNTLAQAQKIDPYGSDAISGTIVFGLLDEDWFLFETNYDYDLYPSFNSTSIDMNDAVTAELYDENGKLLSSVIKSDQNAAAGKPVPAKKGKYYVRITAAIKDPEFANDVASYTFVLGKNRYTGSSAGSNGTAGGNTGGTTGGNKPTTPSKPETNKPQKPQETKPELSRGKITDAKSSKAGQAALAWKKDAQADGYEIRYSRSKSLNKDVKTVKVSGNSKTKKTIKNLAKGKTYYFQVRSYGTADGKRIYGAYSKTAKVKVSGLAQTGKLNKKKATVAVGGKVTLKLTGVSGEVTWKSSKPSVASVAKGRVQAKAAGKAKITASCAGKTYTCTVTVVPKKTKLISAKSQKKGKAILKWKSLSGVKGYEIRYSTDKAFKKNVKKTTVAKAKAKKTTISGLEKGRTYYFQIRAYAVNGGKELYGAYSNTVKVSVRS